MAAKLDFAAARAGTPVRLVPQGLAKPWGRRALGDWGLGLDDSMAGQPIGEIHHVGAGDDPALLIKTLFTADRLSVQVHPDDRAARASGARRGKDEAWVVLAAEPGAQIGLGLASPTTVAALRAAALDGSIVGMMRWHDCVAGDVFVTPAGTIHAIGSGVTLFEIQQNCDLTYRLYDYGSGRTLHLDDAIAVADTAAWAPMPPLPAPGPERELLVAGPGFVLERLRIAGAGRLAPPVGVPAWVAISAGEGQIGGEGIAPGEVWLLDGHTGVAGDAELLVAHVGTAPAAALWQPA